MANTSNTVNLPPSSTTYSGTLLTSNGFNGTSYTTAWTQPINNFVSNNGKAIMTIPANGQEVILEKDAALVVKGTVKINGIDLEERLKTIENMLNIPERDVILEAKYPKLKKMYDEYIKELSKARMWESLKGTEND
jgi:pyruvate carboxylase